MRVKVPVLGVLIVLLVALAAAAPAAAVVRDDLKLEVLHLINVERTSRGLHAVRLDEALGRAASAHARDMMVRDYFSHVSPEGATCVTRARQGGYRASGYSCWRIAEVIAWGMQWKGTPEAVVDGWMHSPYHRAVLLGRSWRDVGVACVEGDFNGSGDSFMYAVDVGRRVR
jgi:uncharacterized protein YkwD